MDRQPPATHSPHPKTQEELHDGDPLLPPGIDLPPGRLNEVLSPGGTRLSQRPARNSVSMSLHLQPVAHTRNQTPSPDISPAARPHTTAHSTGGRSRNRTDDGCHGSMSPQEAARRRAVQRVREEEANIAKRFGSFGLMEQQQRQGEASTSASRRSRVERLATSESGRGSDIRARKSEQEHTRADGGDRTAHATQPPSLKHSVKDVIRQVRHWSQSPSQRPKTDDQSQNDKHT